MKFGDIGIERSEAGDRMVMWIAPMRIVILFSTVPWDKNTGGFRPGEVTYEIKDTQWQFPDPPDA